MRRATLIRGFVLTVGLGALSGCISFGRDAVPDFPPHIDPHVYDARIAETKAMARDDRPRMSIGGARIARGGIYVDLVLANMPRIEGETSRDDIGLGDYLSDLKDPSQFIEIRDANDAPVSLRPMQRPRMGGIVLPGTCILYAHVRNHVAEVGEKVVYVDTCAWRTKGTLEPGMYRIRLLPPQSSEGEGSRMARIADFHDIDTEWRTVQVEWAVHAECN